jgi:hypothetical protein
MATAIVGTLYSLGGLFILTMRMWGAATGVSFIQERDAEAALNPLPAGGARQVVLDYILANFKAPDSIKDLEITSTELIKNSNGQTGWSIVFWVNVGNGNWYSIGQGRHDLRPRILAKKATISGRLSAVIGEEIGLFYYSHANLNALFLEHGATEDVPDGGCVDKCTTWLRRAARDPSSDPFALLGGVLRDFMDGGGSGNYRNVERAEKARARVRTVLGVTPPFVKNCSAASGAAP